MPDKETRIRKRHWQVVVCCDFCVFLFSRGESVMKPRASCAARKLTWLVSLLVLILLDGVAVASERYLIPEQANLPYWQAHSGSATTASRRACSIGRLRI